MRRSFQRSANRVDLTYLRHVRISQEIETAQRNDESLIKSFPKSYGAEDYKEVVKEMLKKLK